VHLGGDCVGVLRHACGVGGGGFVNSGLGEAVFDHLEAAFDRPHVHEAEHGPDLPEEVLHFVEVDVGLLAEFGLLVGVADAGVVVEVV